MSIVVLKLQSIDIAIYIYNNNIHFLVISINCRYITTSKLIIQNSLLNYIIFNIKFKKLKLTLLQRESGTVIFFIPSKFFLSSHLINILT